MKNIFFIFITISLVSVSYIANGQSSCANALYEANKSYESGDFAKSVSRLLPCIKSGFSRDEKWEGYRLLALDYIYLNEPQQADSAVKNMLIRNHSYKLFPVYLDDPASFTSIMGTYDVKPVLTLGLVVGFNFANIDLTADKAVTNSTASYQPLIGYQFGVTGDYQIWKALHISAAIESMGDRYEHDFDSVAGWNEKYTENLTYLHVPISVRYYFLSDNTFLKPYIEAGASFDFLTQVTANIVNTDNSAGTTNSTSINPTIRRNKENTSILYGAGLTFKAGVGSVTLNARYLYGLSPIVNAANRYNDVDFIFNYQYVDDDFKLNNWQFNIGYMFPISYKIEKIKK